MARKRKAPGGRVDRVDRVAEAAEVGQVAGRVEPAARREMPAQDRVAAPTAVAATEPARPEASAVPAVVAVAAQEAQAALVVEVAGAAQACQAGLPRARDRARTAQAVEPGAAVGAE